MMQENELSIEIRQREEEKKQHLFRSSTKSAEPKKLSRWFELVDLEITYENWMVCGSIIFFFVSKNEEINKMVLSR